MSDNVSKRLPGTPGPLDTWPIGARFTSRTVAARVPGARGRRGDLLAERGAALSGGRRSRRRRRAAGRLSRGVLAASGLRVRHIVNPVPDGRVVDASACRARRAQARPDDRRIARYRGIVSTLKAVDARLYIQVCAELTRPGSSERGRGRMAAGSSSRAATTPISSNDAAVSRTTGGGLRADGSWPSTGSGSSAADRSSS